MGFKKAENKMAYLKMGIMGFPSSGKSYTSFVMAKGLHAHLELKKPICVLDTENAKGFLLEEFGDEKTEFLEPEKSSLAFNDLLITVKDAERECSILIIDSISAIWDKLLEDIMIKKRKKDTSMYIYTLAIREWRAFTAIFLNSNLHIIYAGRAGFAYTQQESESGKMESVATGTKMRGESQMGYEPSLLIEMERIRGKEIGAKVTHMAHVVKDRAGKNGIDGLFKPDPTFDFFMPHIEALNIGGKHEAYDTTLNSQDLFEAGGDSWDQKKRDREIACEELKDQLMLKFSGTTVDKKAKIEFLEELFGTTSWTEIENVSSKKVTINKILDITQMLKEKNQKKEG